MPKSPGDPREVRKLCEYVGRQIERAQRAADLSNRDLALQVGVSEPTASAWKAGVHFPSLENLFRVARVTGQPIQWFWPVEEGHGAALEELGRALVAHTGARRATGLLELPQKVARRRIDAILSPDYQG